MNVADMNGRPVVVDRLARTERTIDPVNCAATPGSRSYKAARLSRGDAAG